MLRRRIRATFALCTTRSSACFAGSHCSARRSIGCDHTGTKSWSSTLARGAVMPSCTTTSPVVFTFLISFGQNLDAVNDCLSDVASGDYGRHPDAAGLVVVLVAFDSFAALDRKTAQSLLDIFASQARRALLIGHRLICLVQSNDPGLRFDPVGATPVLWNDAESNDSQRGA